MSCPSEAGSWYRTSGITPPQVSVIIPTHNCAGYLVRSVPSVLAQTFGDFELIVVDDGSTDDSAHVLADFGEEQRLAVHRHERQLGPSASRNTGLRAARGRFIAFLDADDAWEPETLETLLEAFASPEIDVSCIAALRHSSKGNYVITKSPPFNGDALYEELLFNNSIPGSSSGIMVRRESFGRAGLFDEEMFAAEDRDMWIRLAANCRFAFSERPLVTIERSRPDSAVRDRLRMARGHERFLEKREADIPARFRHLLPRLRRYTYLKVAKSHYTAGDWSGCRRYCLRAMTSSARIDGELAAAASLLVRSIAAPLGSYAHS
jgi:glycosyltransferase involved in cell wall biosynthesis